MQSNYTIWDTNLKNVISNKFRKNIGCNNFYRQGYWGRTNSFAFSSGKWRHRKNMHTIFWVVCKSNKPNNPFSSVIFAFILNQSPIQITGPTRVTDENLANPNPSYRWKFRLFRGRREFSFRQTELVYTIIGYLIMRKSLKFLWLLKVDLVVVCGADAETKTTTTTAEIINATCNLK